MRIYQCEPGTEIIGQQALSFVDNVNIDNIRPCLQQRRLTWVDPLTWYPLQGWLDVLNDIAPTEAAGLEFVAMGTSMGQNVWLPAAVARMPVESFFLEGFHRIYQMQYRGGNAGRIRVKRLEARRLRFNMTTPYPDDLIYGIVYGFALRFLSPAVPVKLEFDETTPRCDMGGSRTVLTLAWG